MPYSGCLKPKEHCAGNRSEKVANTTNNRRKKVNKWGQ